MKKDDLALGLKEMARELEPFIGNIQPSRDALTYTHSDTGRRGDPYALAWWSTLIDMAGLMEAQDSDISLRQNEYVKHTLFGGMGSFSDFSLDRRDHGERVDPVNQRLKEMRSKVFALLTK